MKVAQTEDPPTPPTPTQTLYSLFKKSNLKNFNVTLPLHEWFISKAPEAPKQQRLLPLPVLPTRTR